MNSKIKSLDNKMQTGYKFYLKNETEECFTIWFETWGLVKEIINENQIKSLKAFDKTYKLTQFLSNWVMDFQEVLQNTNNHEICISFCEWLLPLFTKGELNRAVIKTAIAESYFSLNNKEMGEKWFYELTEEQPQHVWGWINWSRQYWLFYNGDKDYKKGEEILLKASKIKNSEDDKYIYESLLELYKESGQKKKSKDIEKKLKKMNPFNTDNNFGILSGETALKKGNIQENIPYGFGVFDSGSQPGKSNKKIGRNDPCPCGSGKKYKKCCLK